MSARGAFDVPPQGLSAEYWKRMSEDEREMYLHIRPMPKATYQVDIHLSGIERFLESQARDQESMGGVLELVPDYQRGYVWDEEQKVKYVESFLRGCAPKAILFNCPAYTSDGGEKGDIAPHTFQCIDGLQRLTALRLFMQGEMVVFGRYRAEDLKGTTFAPGRYTFSMAVYEFAWREYLLQFYIDLNRGGTAHTESEMERVMALKAKAVSEAALRRDKR